MALKEYCTNCDKRNTCTEPCEEIEEQVGPDFKEKTSIISEYTGKIDSKRKIDLGVAARSTADSDLDRNFDKSPGFDPPGLVLERNTRNRISEFTRRCHHKEKNFNKHLFNAFLRCNTEKQIALKAGKHKQVIQRYLARICKCILKWISREFKLSEQQNINLQNFILTPLEFKKKFIFQRGLAKKSND